MKKMTTENETFDDDIIYHKRHRESRSKEKYQARRKVDAYMERKHLIEMLDDYNDDWSDYSQELEWFDYVSRDDGSDYRI